MSSPNKWCFVPGCTSTSKRTPNKIFVTVPRNKTIITTWFKAARRDPPTSKCIFFCCEDHFNLEEDMENYLKYKLVGGNIKIKEGVVPHKFDCQEDRKRAFTKPPRPATEKRRRIEIIKEAMESSQQSMSVEQSIGQEEILEPQMVETFVPQPLPEPVECVMPSKLQDTGIQVQIRPPYHNKSISVVPKKISVQTSPFIFTKSVSTSPLLLKSKFVKKALFTDIKTEGSSSETESVAEEEENIFVTGTASSETEVSSIGEITSALNITLKLIKEKPKFYIGVPEPWFEHIIPYLSEKCNVMKMHIMLTLMKLKLNDSFVRIGDQFNISERYASKIFHRTVTILSHLLKPLIHWPDKDSIKKNLPITFRFRYNNVQAIIDCLEIEIQKPSDPVKQALTWSEYKKCNTIKYLVSCTPDGLINFVSNGYGGRITDATIFQESGFLDKLSPGIHIMADRGFKHIQRLLEDVGCILVKPPSVHTSTKPTKSEVLLSKQIASLRIHIERVIRRIREFAFLKPHAAIHHSLIGITDNVIILVSALINLQTPIIKQT